MYFDLQVNGYAGVDFNADTLGHEALYKACELLRDHEVGGILATIITDEIPLMTQRLKQLVALREKDPLIHDMIVGLHIEGPFISPEPGYVGAHPPHAVKQANPGDMERLLEAAGGLTRIVTLAPEQDPGGAVTRLLADQDILVSAGHTNADSDTLYTAVEQGLQMFTHLGNGCPMQLHRHENIIQRVLSMSDLLWITFIADGAHIPYPALGNYLDLVGIDRAIVVTDAIAAAGLGPGRYTLAGQEVDVGADGVAWAADRSHLVGSATSMPEAEKNLAEHIGLDEDSIHGLVYANPMHALKRPLS